MEPQLILVNWKSEAVNLNEIFTSQRLHVHFAADAKEAAKAVIPSTFLALWDARGEIPQTLEALAKWEADPDLARPPLVLIVRADEVSELLSERPEIDLAFMHPAQLSGRVSQYLALFDQRVELRALHQTESRLRQDLALDRQHRETAQRLMSENERALSHIFKPMETSGEALLLANPNGITYYTNPAFQQLTGLDAKAAFGTPAIEVLDIGTSPLSFNEIMTIVKTSGPWRGEVVLGTPPRPQRKVHLDVEAVPGQNEDFEGYLFVIRDVNLLREVMDNLQALAQFDLLTQLYNKAYFLERLGTECGRSQRYKHPMVLVILDVDRFKEINKQWSHMVGDTVLAQLGSLVRQLIRTTDFAARHDGDTFSIALPETDLEGGLAFAVRLGEAISDHEFGTPDNSNLSITCSIGLAAYQFENEDAETFFETATGALRKAKEKGGDCVEKAH